MPKPVPRPYELSTSQTPDQAEAEKVHAVYEAIAPHFSLTRYKPWPLVSQFLASLPAHTLGLDSGGGNGKYTPLGCQNGREAVVLDMSWGLLSVARQSRGEGDGRKVECLRGELGYNGWRGRVFDWAISIAAIHHLTTPVRRIEATRALLDCLVLHRRDSGHPYSRFMIYVWAYEQGQGSKRKMGKRATNGSVTAEGELQAGTPPAEAPRTDGTGEKGEIVQDVLVPWVLQPKPGTKTVAAEEPKVYHRYYHLFTRGELREMVESAATLGGYALPNPGRPAMGAEEKWLRFVNEGWEADNWWLEGEVGIGPRPEAD